MDTLTFLEKILGSLAWPMTLFAVIFVLRWPLRELIGRINGVTVSKDKIDVSLAEVQKKLEEAGRALPEPRAVVIQPASKTADKTRLHFDQKNIERVSLPALDADVVVPELDLSATPKQIMEKAWQRLEKALREHADRELANAPKSFPSLLHVLQLSNTLPEEIFHIIHQLEDVRTKLKQGLPISRSVAVSFAHTADRLISTLSG